MISHGFGVLLASTLFVLLSVQSAVGLKCWRCSSDSATGKFCADPFDTTKLTEAEHRMNYVECAKAPAQAAQTGGKTFATVCKKIEQLVNGQTVISRSCSWQDEADAPDACMADPTPSFIQTQHCQTCNTDGCNGEIQFGEPNNAGVPLTTVAGLVGITATLALARLI